MKNPILAISLVLVCGVAHAGSPFAPRPLSITPVERGVTADGENYTAYAVKCTNRDYAPLIGFNSERRYCAGDNACSRDKIRAAQAACKAGAGSLDAPGDRMIGKRGAGSANPS